MVEIDVKDDFLLKNEILHYKNVDFVYKGKHLKIQRKITYKFETHFSILQHFQNTNVTLRTPPNIPNSWVGQTCIFSEIFI